MSTSKDIVLYPSRRTSTWWRPAGTPSGCEVGVNCPTVPTWLPSMYTCASDGVISKLRPPRFDWSVCPVAELVVVLVSGLTLTGGATVYPGADTVYGYESGYGYGL